MSVVAAIDAQTQKRINTARAQAALLGGTLTVFENDFGRPELALSRWCYTRCFKLADLDELEAVLAVMAGAS